MIGHVRVSGIRGWKLVTPMRDILVPVSISSPPTKKHARIITGWEEFAVRAGTKKGDLLKFELTDKFTKEIIVTVERV